MKWGVEENILIGEVKIKGEETSATSLTQSEVRVSALLL